MKKHSGNMELDFSFAPPPISHESPPPVPTPPEPPRPDEETIRDAKNFAVEEFAAAESAEETDEEPDEESEEEPAEAADEAADESDEEVAGILEELREEVAASSTENRRNTRRIFDALKQFGGVLDALSATVNDLHAKSRVPAPPPPQDSRFSTMAVVELADRVDRISAAFAREPVAARSWWPPDRRAAEAWRADRERLADSFSILTTHVATLLKNSGLERIRCGGRIFDPSCMQAVEAVLDSSVSDHTVLAELLPGWRESGGQVVRPTHVRVSRAR